MCGIAGIVDFSGRPVDETLLARMCLAMQHRGPDDRGLFRSPARDGTAEPTVGLASQRLSIIDVAGGRQPIANEDATVRIVLNGEIYNFQSLRSKLEARGHRFTTRTDTEVILHLYEERGEDCVKELEGMFAFAIWDSRRRCLLVARDRFGKKPLLYARDGPRFRFASEFQALLADEEIETEIDPKALDCYLSFLAIPAPLTIYRDIRKLPPAHLLTFDRNGLQVKRYWELEYGPKLACSDVEAEEQLRDLFIEAIKKRVVSEVPLGAFLSGGIDSSAVVAVLANLLPRPVKTFSIGFEEAQFNELPYARKIAETFHCEHHEFVVRSDAVNVLPHLARHYGEPYADSSALPTYHLAKETRRHVTVALNGDGGDEAFGGYPWHLGNLLAERWQRVPSIVRGPAERVLRALGGENRHCLPARAARFMRTANAGRAERYRAWTAVCTDDLKASILVDDLLATGASRSVLDGLFDGVVDLDPVDAILSVDSAHYLPTDLLVKVDIATMANSLEGRSPFLDHQLVEFCARLPSRLKVRNRTSKYVLKKMLSNLLPRDTLRRRKAGFEVPIAAWLRGDLKTMAYDLLLTRRFAERGLFRPKAVARLLEEHQSGTTDHASPLWTLLMFELWHREVLDRRREAVPHDG